MKALLLISLFLVACSPSHKLRKAQRLIDEAIASGKVSVKADTVWQTKIIKGDSVRVEIPVWSKVRDTTIYQDRAVLRFIHHHDTIEVQAKCLPDTIRIPVTVHQSIICPPCEKGKLWKGIGIGAGGLLILLILFALARAIRA